MKLFKIAAVAVVWAASLLAVGVWAQGGSGANVQRAPEFVRPNQPTGPVISGENLGFQPMGPGTRDGRLMGRLVVRVNGEWLEIVSAVSVVRTDSR